MTTLVQIAPGVVFAAEVLNPAWGHSIREEARLTGRQGGVRDAANTRDSLDRDAPLGDEDRGEQIALL